MRDAYVVTGTLTDGRTVALDEGLPLGPTKVRVVIEPLPAEETGGRRPYRAVIAEIGHHQRKRGHHPPARDAVDARVRAERVDWDA